MTSFAKLLDEDGLSQRHHVVEPSRYGGNSPDSARDGCKQRFRPTSKGDRVWSAFDCASANAVSHFERRRRVGPKLETLSALLHDPAGHKSLPTRSAHDAAERDRLTDIKFVAQPNVAADVAAFVNVAAGLAS